MDCRRGDVANKIGTYWWRFWPRAISRFVAAPLRNDMSLASGEIPTRSGRRSEACGNHPHGPEEVPARHPAFDVTPARYITAIITEAGVAKAPYEKSLKALFEGKS
jgi:methylthioribose-1-phosphate isomerase